MKTVKHIYEKMCSEDTIYQAIIEASRHKTKRKDVKRVLDNIDKHVKIIKNMLDNKNYVPSPYHVTERYDHRSKKTRIIRRPKFFPDQVIHWVIILSIKDIFMKSMYYWNCGSIPRRGISHGCKAVKRWLKNDKKNTKYCLKLDIRHFYDSVPHDVLKQRLRRKIKDKDALWLIDKIIDTTDTGIPIGNYTSQWLANFYLEALDNYIKQELKVKYYVRYIDDLVLFGRNKKELHKARKAIFQYLNEVFKLEVKDNWQLYLVKSRGVDFLGYVFFHSCIKLRKRNFLALVRQCRRVRKKINNHQRIPASMAAGLISRIGQLKHCDSYNIRQKYCKNISLKMLKEIVSNESKRKLLSPPVRD